MDRLRAVRVVERHPTLEYLPMSAPEAAEQIVAGLYAIEGRIRWTARAAVVALKAPAAPRALAASFTIHPASPARHIRLLLDGREVAAQTYTAPGTYTLSTAAPVRPAGAVAVVTLEVDRTFTAPPDTRDLGLVLSGVGFTGPPALHNP